MQGWGQAYLIAEQDLIPENLQVGPNYVLKLPVNPQSQVRPEFGFASASSDVSGSMEFVTSLLSMFLTSRGIDPKLVSTTGESEKFTSGLDRLLSMVQNFEASSEDFARFKTAEAELFEIVKAWHNESRGEGGLDDAYLAEPISDEVDLSVTFAKPEMIQSDAEKLQSIRERLELGLITQAEAVARDRGITVEQAEEMLAMIESGSPEAPQEATDGV
jgi:hypothetical protein